MHYFCIIIFKYFFKNILLLYNTKQIYKSIYFIDKIHYKVFEYLGVPNSKRDVTTSDCVTFTMRR